MRTIGAMWHPKWFVVFGVCLLGLILGAPRPAMAQETPGYDPKDPAGVEYQLPLQRTRREATGRKPEDRRGGASKPAPLFGAGVGAVAGKAAGTRSGGAEREGSGPPGGADASKPGGPGGAAAGSRGRKGSGTAGSAGASTPAKGAKTTEEASSPLKLGLAGGVLVVLLGAAVGIVVRLRTRAGQSAG